MASNLHLLRYHDLRLSTLMKIEPASVSHRFNINTSDLSLATNQHSQQHLTQLLPKEIGLGQSNIYQLDTDLTYIESQYVLSKDVSISSQLEFETPRLIVTVSLDGSSRFCSQQGEDFLFTSGYTTITKVNSSMGKREYPGQQTVSQLRFSIGKGWLDKYFGENSFAHIFTKNTMELISYKSTTHPGLFAARQLVASKNKINVSTPFLHGQALLLLSSELDHLINDLPDNAIDIHSCEKDKKIIKLAEAILYEEYKQPPSVEELARRVGTNQFKLKKLFHHYLNTTPYGLLLEIRMNIAYQLLQNTHCHVNEASEKVGYQYANNFSNAFTKYFGVSPKYIAKHQP